jgi:hypothetical protein
MGYTRRRKTKQQYNTICVGHHYAKLNINNGNTNNWWYRRCEHILCENRNGHHNTEFKPGESVIYSITTLGFRIS